MDDRGNGTKRVVAIAALLSAAAEAHAEYEQSVLKGVYDTEDHRQEGID